MDFINNEVDFINKNLCDKVEGVEILGCHSKLVTFIITKTEYRKLTVSLQFPASYPDSPIHVELKSKVIPHEVLQQVCKICEKELELRLGSQQILALARFLKKFLDENPLLPCKDELMKAKRELFQENLDEMKLKQKQGIVIINAKFLNYAYQFKIEVPDDYPSVAVTIQGVSSNFPSSLAYYFVCHAREIARQCVQKPLDKKKSKEKFEPKPHIHKIIKFLVQSCVKNYPSSICPVCNKKCLPDDPMNVIKDEKHKDYVQRIYCGHLYHHGCLQKYMKSPPFPKSGKECLVCKKKVAHCRYNISPKIAEQRWAHREARKRELAEVVDFFK